MANIHTLRDLEGGGQQPTTRPFPNAWAQQGPRVSTIHSHPQPAAEQRQWYSDDGEVGFSMQPQQSYVQPQLQLRDPFWSDNLAPGQPLRWYHIPLVCCCPCLVGNPCSLIRRKDYLRMLTTFIFWITLLDILYFLAEMVAGIVVMPNHIPFAPFSQNPSLGPSGEVLLLLGAKFSPLIRYRFQLWRLVTPMMMHAGLLHIFINLLIQMRIGLMLEQEWKTWRMVLIYISSGIAGNLLSCILRPDAVGVGASGALMGIIGAQIAFTICSWFSLDPMTRIASSIQYVLFLVLTLVFGFSSYVDSWAHLGGLLIGGFMGMALFAHRTKTKVLHTILPIVFTAITAIYTMAVIALLWTVIPVPEPK